VPLISFTRSFTDSYTLLNLDYLELLHDVQIEAIKLTLNSSKRKLGPSKLREKISSQLSDDIIGKISLKDEKLKIKVTYEVEYDSTSGEVKLVNLIDVIDVQNSALELDSNNQKSELLVKKYIGLGYKLKKTTNK
jgi:hypothetical protein